MQRACQRSVAVVQGFVHAWQVHRAAVQEHKLLVACQVRAAAGLAGMGLAHKAHDLSPIRQAWRCRELQLKGHHCLRHTRSQHTHHGRAQCGGGSAWGAHQGGASSLAGLVRGHDAHLGRHHRICLQHGHQPAELGLAVAHELPVAHRQALEEVLHRHCGAHTTRARCLLHQTPPMVKLQLGAHILRGGARDHTQVSQCTKRAEGLAAEAKSAQVRQVRELLQLGRVVLEGEGLVVLRLHAAAVVGDLYHLTAVLLEAHLHICCPSI
mmetsp:Transcript_23181/g.64050  ORF Transcript_23181/g.64050 Transcript_23181/m.64050 type:complete len:267 (-) Transcript_23181:224-1024(-)